MTPCWSIMAACLVANGFTWKALEALLRADLILSVRPDRCATCHELMTVAKPVLGLSSTDEARVSASAAQALNRMGNLGQLRRCGQLRSPRWCQEEQMCASTRLAQAGIAPAAPPLMAWWLHCWCRGSEVYGQKRAVPRVRDQRLKQGKERGTPEPQAQVHGTLGNSARSLISREHMRCIELLIQ